MSCFSHLAPCSVLSASLSCYASATASIYPKQEPLKQTPTPRPDHMLLAHDPVNTATGTTTNVETFYGYVKNRLDALLLIEACITRSLFPLNVIPADLSQIHIRSGTVLVFAENNHHSMMVRWRDGERWSPSRIHGQFLLYREVSSTRNTHYPLTTTETCARFSTSGARPNTRLVPNGFAKRTITLTGSDSKRYRVISYFYPSDVAHLYGDPPDASVVFRHASDPRVVPANVLLCTPAQIPSIKQLITRVRKEYIDGSAVDGASVEMEQRSVDTPRSPQIQSRMHPYAHHELVIRRGCPCGGLGGRRWTHVNPNWANAQPILAPINNLNNRVNNSIRPLLHQPSHLHQSFHSASFLHQLQQQHHLGPF
ncbi:Gti1/Pac2 family-domain-containing protein [Chytriomyces cf. hyalinus JEL632]|nr:Gti1/Pac2 family-domain-containing protein [Chytriomyces cf. hyalinus JEL632]